MKALLCETYGPIDQLVFKEIFEPELLADEVKIKVKACSINFPDTLIIQNLYQLKPNLPFAPGGEISGIIEAVGSEVQGFKPGDEVFAICKFGGLAERVQVSQNLVYHNQGLDFITAASLSYNYGTSYHALKDRAKLIPGESILILGASGGVGIAAVELAKAMGATVIAAASSEEKLKLCASKGADFLINYKTQNLKEEVKSLTQNQGVDVVYDPVGGDYSEAALRCMAWRGRYLVVGFANGSIPKIPLNLALLKGCSIVGVFWGKFAEEEQGRSRQNLQELMSFHQAGQLKPHIHKIYSFEDSKTALSDMASRKVLGKAVVVLEDDVAIRALPKGHEKMVFTTIDQLLTYKGKHLGTSSWQVIDQVTIDEFAYLTRDFQWIHLDKQRAKETVFHSTIAHGFLSLSFVSKMLSEIYEIKFAQMGINYGSDKVRFLTPVKVDSRVRLEVNLKDLIPIKGQGYKMLLNCVMQIENQDKPAFIADIIMVFYQ